MRNYQKLYYQHYYKMLPDGTETEVTRRECFAPAKDPTPDCPFSQRWWYDPEASYAIRLPRSPLGETLGKRNAADRKKQERIVASDAEHIGIELDKPIGYGDDGAEVYTELEDATADVYAICEDKSQLEALMDVLNTLSDDDRELWELMKVKAKKQDIADRFNITLDGVRYREKRLKGIIGSDPVLKSFYTDN
jgi:hypothetical protein